MKRETFYAVDFDNETRYFRRKYKAVRFGKDCGDPHWRMSRQTMLGTGMRAGVDRRPWKKAKTKYYFPNAPQRNFETSYSLGRPLSETLQYFESIGLA